jgi:hypothetical protein
MVDQVYKPFLVTFVLFFIVSLKPVFSGCSSVDSSWQGSDVSSGMKFLLENCNQIDSSCFYSVLQQALAQKGRKNHQDSVILFVKKWTEQQRTTTNLLFLCYRSDLIYSRKSVWALIVSDWEKDNETLYGEIDNLVKRGFNARADTLYSIFDAEGKLDSQDWLKWAKIKGLMGDYSKIAMLYCKAIQKEPMLSVFALHQLGRELKDSDSGTAEKVLEQFSRCSIEFPGSDTVSIYSWLADIYAELGFYRQELIALKLISSSGGAIAARALEAAQKRYSLHKYREALEAARISYQSTDRFSIRSMAATIAYQSFLKLGQIDSAAGWLTRMELGSDKNRVEAITFYQNCSDFANAALLIDSLAVSVARDSLFIRQFVLQGEIQKALTYFNRPELKIHRDQKNAALWKARILLFSGKYEDFTAFLDTLDVAPFWECARELISYQYWIARLGSSSESLAAWASIEYNLYCGSFHKISQELNHSRAGNQIRRELLLYAGKSCITLGRHKEALMLLESDTLTEETPEFLYCRAEALYHCGDAMNARAVFNRIILEFPADLYSDKARVFINEHNLVN